MLAMVLVVPLVLGYFIRRKNIKRTLVYMSGQNAGDDENCCAEIAGGDENCAPASGRIRRGPFMAGEDVLLISPKQEERLITLGHGKVFGTHKGNLLHDDLIGKEDGCRAWTAMGDEYRAFRPTYIQFIMNQKRRAQIIYPKDTGAILMWADIFPGATVIEVTGTSADPEMELNVHFPAKATGSHTQT